MVSISLLATKVPSNWKPLCLWREPARSESAYTPTNPALKHAKKTPKNAEIILFRECLVGLQPYIYPFSVHMQACVFSL